MLLYVVFALEKVPVFTARRFEARENAEIFTETYSISFVL